MDLELGLKITKTRDDIASISEYRLAKAGPIFQSKETNTAFILTAHLKGYKKNNININISEDGSKISISGEKPVQNILMMGWLMHRKEVDVAGFSKVFKIPDGVKLDGIKAKYDEEEWIMNIIMPKLVKGICGAKIEEVKEEESDRSRRRSEQEKSEGDHILSGVGETSQKGSKESEVQTMEDSESFVEKKEEVSNRMLDDSNMKTIKDTVHKEVEESKVGTDGGNGDSFGEKVGKEGYEVMKTSEPEQNVGIGTSQKIGEISQKEPKLKNDDGGVKGTREEVGNTTYEAAKTFEKGKSVGEGMPRNIGGDTRQDKVFEVQERENNEGFVEKEEKGVSENMLDDANATIIGEVIQKHQEESKSEIKDRDGGSVKEKTVRVGDKGMKTSEIEQNVGAHVTQNIGDTIQGVSKESILEQMGQNKSTAEKMETGEMLVEDNVSTEGEKVGESNQKQFAEPRFETEDRVKESVKESRMETLKAPQLDQNVDDQITGNIGGISQEKFKESRIQWKEKTESTKEKVGESNQKQFAEPRFESKDRVKESVKESRMETMKTPQLDQNVDDQSPSNIGGISKEDFKESRIQWKEKTESTKEKVGESNQKQFAEPSFETKDRVKESVKESRMETMKAPQLDQNVDDQSPSNIGGKSQEDFEESKIQWKEKTESTKENMDGGEYEKIHVQTSKDGKKHTFGKSIQENIKRPEIGTGGISKEDFKESRIQWKEKTESTKEKVGESNQKQFAEPSFETKDRVKESVKESRMETMKTPQLDQNVDDQSPSNIGGKSQEDFEESKIQWKEKTESTKENMDGGEYEKIHVQTSKDGKKHTFGKSIQENIKRPEIGTGNGDQEYDEVKAGKEEFDSKVTIREEFPQQLPKSTIEESKRLSISKMQETKDVKEANIKTKLKENEYSVDKDEGEKLIRMHKEAKKDLVKKITRENEDVKEAMDQRERNEIEYFVDNNEGGEHKRRHVEEKKDLTKETMKKNEVAMEKRENKENEYFAEAWKDLTTEKIQETEDIKEEMSKRKDKEIENFEDKCKGKEPSRLHVEAKDLKKETIQESEDVEEAMLKKEVKNDEPFRDKRGEKPKIMHMEAKKNIAEDTMQEKDGVKEAIVKRKGEEIGNFTDKGEGEEPTKMLMNEKTKLTEETKQESERVNEAMVKRKGKETEHFVDKGGHKSMHVEAKKDLTTKTIQESGHVEEAMVKREGSGYEYFVDKGEEYNRMHMELKNDISQETKGVKDAMVKRKGKEIGNFANKDEGDKHTIHMKTKKETKGIKSESKKVKETIVKRKGKETKDFADRGEDEEPKSLHMEVKKDLTVETIQEREDVVKEEIIKREDKHCEYSVDKDVEEEPKRMHIEPKKDSTKEKFQEIEGLKEAMVKIKSKEIGNCIDKNKGEEHNKMSMKPNKESTKETEQEIEKIEEVMVKRKGKETEYFMDNSEDEEPKGMHVEAKKKLTAETIQEDVRGGKDCEYFVDKDESEETKRKDKKIGNFADKYEGEEHLKMLMKEKKELPKETKKEREKVKEAMVVKKGRETKYFADNGEDEELINMPLEAKKDLTSKTIQESEDMREAMFEKEDKDNEYFVDKGEGEELKMANMKAKKNMGKESMQETEGAKEAMAKREGREFESFAKGEGKETAKKVHMEAKKDLTTVTVQENDDADEGNEKECFLDEGEGEEPNRKNMETIKDFSKETLEESENVKEVKVKNEGKDVECFVNKSEDKESIRMLMGTGRDLAKEKMHENVDVKESMIKRKGKEIEYFVDNSEGEAVEESKRMHIEEKKDLTTKTMHEHEDAKEVMVKSKDKEIENLANKVEGKESKIREAKKDPTKVTMKENEDTKEAMVKRKGKEAEYFVDKGNEPKWKHTEAKKDLTTKIIQENEVATEEMVKREREQEIEYFLKEGKDEKSNRTYVEARKDITKDTVQESDEFKETMIQRKGKEVGCFVDKGEGKEPKRIHMEAKDLTTETTQESENVKEATVKRQGKKIDYFLDKGEGEKPNRMLMGRNSTTKATQESEAVKEATFKRKGKEAESFMDESEDKKLERTRMEVKKDSTKDTMQESDYVKEAIFKREGKETVDKDESEELKRTHEEAQKDITKEKMQEVMKLKHGITDSDQQHVLGKPIKGKFEVPTEECPKLVGGQDRSERLKVENMKEPKEIIEEEMTEIESLMEKVQGEKSKKSEEANRVIQKTTTTEILQKETKESNIERKFRDGSNVPNNKVKVVFELLGTFQAKLPKQVMEVIAQNQKDKNEYVIVELKGEGSIKMHVEPNEAFNEDEIEDTSEKETRNPKLKSIDQMRGKENVDFGVFDGSKRPEFLKKENVDFGVFDGSKRPEFLKMGEIQDDKEDNARIKESAKKIKGDQYEKIQVQEKGRKSTQKGREGPEIQTMVKDQHRLQEEINTGRFEASNATTEKLPMKKIDTLAKTREETKDKEVEELTRRKSEETTVEFTIVEKVEAPESGRICTSEVPEVKHPEVLEIGSPERELQSTKGPTRAKVASEGFKEVEQESAKDKTQKTKLLPPKIQSKGIHESEKGVKQDTIKPKKEKEGEQCTYNIESDEEIARFPSTQQTKVGENDKLYEDGKAQASTESQKEGPTKDTRNLIEIKENQESKQRKTFKSEIPMEKHLKKEGKVTRKDEIHKEQKIRETMQEETERPKEKIVDRDQQYVQRDVAVGVGKVDTVEKEMPLGKTTIITEDKKPKMGEITSEFEKASGFKRTAEKTHESSKREHQRESLEVTPKMEVKPPIMTPKKEVEKPRKEEVSPMPTASQRKEPRELSLPSKDYKISNLKEVQQKNEGKGPMHALEAITSKEGELAQAIATHLKAKSEIDEQQVNQLTSPCMEMRIIEPHKLEKHRLKEDGSKAESLDHMLQGKEFTHSIDSTTTSEIAADEAGEPSKFRCSSSSQPFEVEGKEIDSSSDDDSYMDSEIDSEASTTGETDEEVLQRDTLQPESPEDQQCTHKEDSQRLEEQKECEEEVVGGKKDQKRSKKLIVSTIIAGSALLASGIILFIRHRRSRKSAK